MQATPVENLLPRRRGGKTSRAIECSFCGLYGMCRVAGLESPYPGEIDEVLSRREMVAAGQPLVPAGTPVEEIVAVRSGAFKAVTVLGNGDEQVVDFLLPGELAGLEALGPGHAVHEVVALEDSSVCRFKLSRLLRFGSRMGEFQQQLILALSGQNRRDSWVPLLLGARSAEQRMALFLLGLSSRLDAHGLPGQRFRLPMSRSHIANHLGLAVETVSRIFKRFHEQGLLEVRARRVALSNMQGLRAVAGVR